MLKCDFCGLEEEQASLLLLKEHGGKEARIMLCRTCTIRIGKLLNRRLKPNPPKGD